MSDHHRMFYMLANIHHQVTWGKALPLPNHFRYNLLDLPSRVWRVAESFQMVLQHLVIDKAP